MKQALLSAAPVYKPYIYKGLHGRFVHFPAVAPNAKRTFVVVYGQHATLERIEPIASALAQFGDVYAVDTPGFGGMDPSYKIREHPSLHFLAGHLQNFVNQHIPPDRQLTPLGISFGFQILTQMLADYPDLCQRTEQAMSFVGFVCYNDLDMPLSYKLFLMHMGARSARHRPGAAFLKTALRPGMLRTIFFFNRPFNPKFEKFNKAEARKYVDEQIELWTVNDHRTHGATAWDFYKKNDLRGLRLDADVVHVGVPHDHLINNQAVVSELQQMFRSVHVFDLHLDNHAPLDIDTPEKVQELLPEKLKAVIRQSTNKEAVLQ